jgi:hypothetical protein
MDFLWSIHRMVKTWFQSVKLPGLWNYRLLLLCSVTSWYKIYATLIIRTPWASWLKLLIGIWEVIDSNLGRQTNCSEVFVVSFCPWRQISESYLKPDHNHPSTSPFVYFSPFTQPFDAVESKLLRASLTNKSCLHCGGVHYSNVQRSVMSMAKGCVIVFQPTLVRVEVD